MHVKTQYMVAVGSSQVLVKNNFIEGEIGGKRGEVALATVFNGN